MRLMHIELKVNQLSIDEAENGCLRLLGQEKTILIEQACMFAIVIIVAQPCQRVVTVLMVEQCCNNIVIMAEQPC